MNEIRQGKKIALQELGCGDRFAVTVMVSGPGLVLDIACFGLDASGKLSDDRFMQFYNQREAPGGAVRMDTVAGGATFTLQLAALPPTISRLVFTAALDGGGTMAQIGAGALELGGARFAFTGADFTSERAVIVGEVYRHGDGWRFGAVGQGFAGGLSALLAHFGGQEAAPQAAPKAPAAPVPAATVQLSKVTLNKPGQSHAVSLAKGADAPRMLLIKATWEDNGDKRANNDDLDLRAGLLLPDGRMTLVSAPDTSGSFDKFPFLQHQGDVRVATRKEPATEIIHVNPAIARHCGGRVALVFSVYSAVANGVVAIASLKPRMRMEYGDQVVECTLDPSASRSWRDTFTYTYVLGIAIIDDDKVILAPGGQKSKAGSENTPWLTWRGEQVDVTIDGPYVFKGEGQTKLGSGGKRYI